MIAQDKFFTACGLIIVGSFVFALLWFLWFQPSAAERGPQELERLADFPEPGLYKFNVWISEHTIKRCYLAVGSNAVSLSC